MAQRKSSASSNNKLVTAAAKATCHQAADYSPPYRPARIVDLMHEAVSSFADRSIAFYPLIDAIILLLGKPIALIFHRRSRKDGEPEPFFLTFPEADQEELRSAYLNDPSTRQCLVPLPALPGAKEQYFISLARIKEVPPKAGESYPKLQPDPYRIPAHSVPPNVPPTGLHGEQLDLWLLRRLLLELELTAKKRSSLSFRVLHALHAGLRSRQENGDVQNVRECPSWSDDELAEWEDAKNRIIEEQWREIVDQSLPRVPVRTTSDQGNKVRQALDFLCVFRFALPGTKLRFGKFRYGARIVLGRRQRAAVREWLAASPEFRATLQGTSEGKAETFRETFRNDPDSVLDALELPVGMSYRTISDTHFGSHFLDFAPEASYVGDGPRTQRDAGMPGADPPTDDPEFRDDRRRKAAERLVLDERGSRVLYVPIHVGGVPWIGLLILEDEVRGRDVSDAIWEESYHLYRGPVTTVGQQLRQSSHNAYSAALCSVVNRELTANPRTTLEQLNAGWRKLAAFFPLAVPQLIPADSREKAIEFPGKRKVGLQELDNPNPSFNRPLKFDELRLPAIQHDLQIVLDTVVAKRLNALAFQESSWAHDVKNWTKPIIADVLSLWQRHRKDRKSGDAIYRALIHSRILYATAYARQISGARQQTGEGSPDALDEYLRYRSSSDIESLLALVLDLLLATHAENPEHETSLELCWSQKRLAKDVIAELASYIGGEEGHEALAEPTAVLGLSAVIWPLSLLREVVHNIKINNRIKDDIPSRNRIDIRYEIRRRNNEIVIDLFQSQLERAPWQRRFLSGLQKANRLYGPESANVGWIDEDPILTQKDAVLTTRDGGQVSAFAIDYQVRIRFFLGNSSHGQG